mmetsp:Transcript_27625/g.92798  ORF Transcript_27625/g.92798 Transcript_27625/m.92798 type:complete len:212 (+) Transcript_27625:586-1221(+)
MVLSPSTKTGTRKMNRPRLFIAFFGSLARTRCKACATSLFGAPSVPTSSLAASVLRYFKATSWTVFGNVAENMSVCRSSMGGKSWFCKMSFNSDSKPISSIRSASSKTTKRQFLNETRFLAVKSARRPGVATMISAPPARASNCGRALAPPYIATDHRRTCCKSALAPGTGSPKVSFCTSKSIWIASSRVGARIRADGATGDRPGPVRCLR